MKHTHSTSGFVLMSATIVLLVVSILLGGVISYINFATRASNRHLAASRCRLAAQSAIEESKIEIYRAFRRYSGVDARGALTSLSSAFSWFTYGGTTSVGRGSTCITLRTPQTINGCTVELSFSQRTHASGVAVADLGIIATATCITPDGQSVSRTVEEIARYGVGTSDVFNYAYFINNHGWFQGGGGRAFGDIRANGDMDLDGSCYVHGAVYAAANSEVHSNGDITSTGRFYTPSQYASYAPERARPLGDSAEDDDIKGDGGIYSYLWDFNGDGYISGGEFVRQYNGTVTDGGYKSPDTNNDGIRDDLHRNLSEDEQIYMPFIGDLSAYVTLANDQRQSSTDNTIRQNGNTLVDTYFNGLGPSNLEDGADKGSIVLIGTEDHPIEINGIVCVEGDVLISGYIKGQGTIYAGRNVHILNNLRYVDPPEWENKTDSISETSAENNTKDLVGLSAKGNIVIGNYTSSEWMYGVGQYITPPWVHDYKCDASDADIGYPALFNGNYKAYDGGNQIVKETVGLGTYTTVQTPIYDRRGRLIDVRIETIENTEERYVNRQERRYYESSVSDELITQNARNDISQIDAVLYNNHAIMGKVGACSFNGSLVCRDEALHYSGTITFNWDARLYTAGGEDSLDINLPKSASQPYVLSWREVPES